MPNVLRLACFLAVSAGLFGCAAVAPYERGLLAKRKMQMDPDPESVLLEQHVYEYREGTSGGYGTVGGGCGCN
jgi:hypothetical protein